jgi:NAD(P)-dependent dehydrogenase (short-subunit alcohol dehydrogenase family)
VNHVLITGGASGIGAGTAQLLAATGSRISILDRTAADGIDWWHELPDDLRGHWVTVDAADTVALVAAVEGIAADGLTGLVACAGVSVKEPFVESTIEAWTSTLMINVLGTAMACKAAARAMIAGGRGGAIVTVASTVAFGHVAGLGAHYHASKGAIVALTRDMAGELGQHGIRVNAVAPGLVRTPLTEFMRRTQGEEGLTLRVPLREMADPSDIADAIAFLLSADASMITGHILPVDAGQLSVAGMPLDGFPDIVVHR